MTATAPLRTAVVICRLTPAERARMDAKLAAVRARTGRRVTLSHALREGAQTYLDDLLAFDASDGGSAGGAAALPTRSGVGRLV